MATQLFEALPKDVLRLIVDSLSPVEYFRLRRALVLDKVLRRYLVVSAAQWSSLMHQHMNGVDLLHLVRSKPPLHVQGHLVDLLESFRIDPRPMSRKDIIKWILKLGDFIARDRVLAHIDYTTYPLDRTDCCGSSFFAWKSIAPYIELLGTFFLKSRTKSGAHRLVPRRVADYMMMSAIIRQDVGLMRVFMVQFWYRKLRGDMLIATAIACNSWECLEELFERYPTKETPLRIMSSFENGIKWKTVTDLILRAMDTADHSYTVAPNVLASILVYYFDSKEIIGHKLWMSLNDEKIALVFEALVSFRSLSSIQLNRIKFLLGLPNANSKGNTSYLSTAIASGNAPIIKHLITVGYPQSSQSWIQARAADHSPAKRRKILEMFGFTVDDTY